MDIGLIVKYAGVITSIAAAAAVVWVVILWAKRIINGLKCQLRSDMLHIYYRHHESETIRQYEYENFVMSYEAYHSLGGNSFVDKIYKEVQTWEVLS
jgi:hypothetical protein